MEKEYLGVCFDDWRNHTIYKVKSKKYVCRLCNSTITCQSDHKKTQKHRKLYYLFEDKRYDYIIYEQKRKMDQ